MALERYYRPLRAIFRPSQAHFSSIRWFEGNYDEYEKDRRRRMGADADQPHRIKYRRIDA